MMATDEADKISVDDVELGYRVHEAGRDAPPMVFVHGYAFRSTAGPYDELLDLLARHHAVHALDLRGHGASVNAATGWSKRALSRDVVAFCRALDLDRPVLVGHSFGCEVSILAAADHPDLFSALCLLTPGPADPRQDPVTALDFLVEHGQDRDAVRDAFRPMFRRPPGAMLETVVDAVTLVDSGVHRAQREENSSVSIEHRLEDVSAPTLVVLGGADTVIAPERQHDMARTLARCKEVLFSAEGHMLPLESPTTAAREILAFLDHDANSPSIAAGARAAT